MEEKMETGWTAREEKVDCGSVDVNVCLYDEPQQLSITVSTESVTYLLTRRL